MSEILSGKDWRFELRDGNTSFGFFNHSEIKFGTDGGDTTIDPELGEVLRGGIDTVDPIDLTRKFHKTREPDLFRALMARKNGPIITGLLWAMDPITRKPTTSTPLLTLQVQVREVTLPKGEKQSGDDSEIACQVKAKTP